MTDSFSVAILTYTNIGNIAVLPQKTMSLPISLSFNSVIHTATHNGFSETYLPWNTVALKGCGNLSSRCVQGRSKIHEHGWTDKKIWL